MKCHSMMNGFCITASIIPIYLWRGLMLYSHPREAAEVPKWPLSLHGTALHCQEAPPVRGIRKGHPCVGHRQSCTAVIKCFHSDSRTAAAIFTLPPTLHHISSTAHPCSTAANIQPSEGLLLCPWLMLSLHKGIDYSKILAVLHTQSFQPILCLCDQG